ncbi:MAG: helix-turn-helix transcriptional regulator [Candidatus Competibacteraceae bacterium]|nr:helix-turn-helix transcriptional regulator [Candidatus Competibacteraceae bacterium]
MSDKTLKKIADNVRKARSASGLTQLELAKKAGLSTNYISRIERADVSPTVETLEKLAKALRIKSSDILPF